MESLHYTTVNFDALYKKMISRLQHELSPSLTYHTVEHTISVLDESQKLALAEGVGEEDLLLLKTAALFHDVGFLHTYKKHEEASCNIARETLSIYGYTQAQIGVICQLIMATKLPQRPKTLLEELLCDADLHYLGTADYMSGSERLFVEYKKQSLVKTRSEWQRKQVLFLSSHRFFTTVALRQYEEKKGANLKMLTDTLNQEGHRNLFLNDIFLIVIGVLIAGFGLEGFLMPNHFFDGGVTGISLLVRAFTGIDLSLLILVLNIPFIIFGYFSVGKAFAYKTFGAAVLLGLCLLFIPYPIITEDKLLISIFGGVFLGLGVGLTMRAGCCLDGIEVLALHTIKKTSFTVTEIILVINLFIFSIAAFKFNIETALYSIMTYFVASRMIDFVIEGIQAYTGVTIISGESESIKHQLVNELGRGITVYQGKRGFLPGNYDVSSDCDIIFTVVTRLEMRKLKNLVYETDPKAFVFANTIREATGGIINRRSTH